VGNEIECQCFGKKSKTLFFLNAKLTRLALRLAVVNVRIVVLFKKNKKDSPPPP
jgi:hypothetical protein